MWKWVQLSSASRAITHQPPASPSGSICIDDAILTFVLLAMSLAVEIDQAMHATPFEQPGVSYAAPKEVVSTYSGEQSVEFQLCSFDQRNLATSRSEPRKRINSSGLTIYCLH